MHPYNTDELDEVDRKLLNIIQENADLTYAELANILGISQSSVYVRLKKLKDKGYIKRIIAVLNTEKLGLNLKCFIFINIDIKKYDYVIERLKDFDKIVAIYDVTGEYALIVQALVHNQKELATLLDEIGNIDGVVSTKTVVVLRTIKENLRVIL